MNKTSIINMLQLNDFSLNYFTQSMTLPDKLHKPYNKRIGLKYCSYGNCNLKAITRCTICSNYYCHRHGWNHLHLMENLEVIV